MRPARDARIVCGALIMFLLLVGAVGAPWLAPHDPLEQDLLHTFAPPFWQQPEQPGFPLGTDSLGRDILSRLIYGARVALIVALVAATLAGLLGSALGLVAGYLGGWVDELISRFVDIWMSFPPVLLCILLAAMLGSGLTTVIIAIVVIDWTRFCRVVRTEVLAQKAQDYVASALTIGLRPARIVLTEILPNIFPLLLTLFTLEMGISVVVEAILSFVGLSVSSGSPSWGSLIEEGRRYVHQVWWLLAAPVACLIVTVLGLNALGDGLRDALDPVRRS
jgi:peptide/nickel transport system permease protein